MNQSRQPSTLASLLPAARGHVSLFTALALALLAGSLPCFAGMNDTLQAIQQSEFSFARSSSELPFFPIGWTQDRFYPVASFKEDGGNLPSATMVENTLSVGAVLPAYVAKRDMALLGGDVAWDDLTVKTGPYADQSILRVTPVAAWLHQFGENETVGAFAAPILSKNLSDNQAWGTSGYAGIIALHYFNPEYQLLYGGVYQNSFGQSMGYPYVGLLWLLSPRCQLSIVFPWPTFSYSPADRWLLQLGLAPGGSAWDNWENNLQTTESIGSWNLTAGAAYRFYGKLWLFAGAGVAGLRGIDIETGTDRTTFNSQPSAVFTLAVQFRP